MSNKDLIQFLQIQIDDKMGLVGKNNMENVDLRMNCQHIKSAIEKLKDADHEKGDAE